MAREEITRIIDRLRNRQADVSREIMASARYDDLEKTVANGDSVSVKDILQMWVHEIRSHYRDLIMARGRLTDDNPHYHVPHFVRQANEEFGKFIGELSAMSDDDLDRKVPLDGRTIREVAEHVLESLDGYFVQEIHRAINREDSSEGEAMGEKG